MKSPVAKLAERSTIGKMVYWDIVARDMLVHECACVGMLGHVYIVYCVYRMSVNGLSEDYNSI